jgi:hypothetical protein
MGWLLAMVFLWVAFGHLGLVLRWRARGEGGSLVPFIGGLAGMAACFLLPFPWLAHWWWVPLIVDLGTGFLFAGTVVFLVRRAIKRPPSGGPTAPSPR